MATSVRQWAHRKLDASINSQRSSIQHLEDISEKYDEEHPRISQALTAIQSVQLELLEMTERMKTQF